MAKLSGLGASLAVDDSGGTARTVSNDILSISVSTPRGMQDVSGMNVSAMERLLLRADGKFDYAYVFNDTVSTGSFAVFSTASSTSVTRTHTYTVQSKVLAGEYLIPDFPLALGADGALTGSISAVLNSTVVPTWA